MKEKRARRAAIFLSALLLLGGCGKGRETPSAPTASPPPGQETQSESAGTGDSAPSGASLRISEVAPANRSLCPGADGSFPDYLEIWNSGSESCDLTGFLLSQKASLSGAWRFPAVTLAGGECLLLCCDGVNGPDFGLSRKGESLYLADGQGRAIHSVTWPELQYDEVWLLDGDETFSASRLTSPGRPNAGESAPLCPQPGALRISEVVVSNLDYRPAGLRDSYDWVELENTGTESVCLSSYCLSDRPGQEGCLPLPDITLAPGERTLLFCTGKNAPDTGIYPSLGLGLDAVEDWLYLTESDGAPVDYCALRGIPKGGSYGRVAGEEGFFYFTDPTPLAENGRGWRAIAEKPRCDTEQGVYEGVSSLRCTLSGPGDIYYTLDGSQPDANSTLYTGPISFSASGVLRAVALEEGKLPSPVATWSYILNEGHSLPVVSLVVDPTPMFVSYEGFKGIYSIPSQARIDPEIDASMAFFEPGGGCAADCTLELHGASTRNTREKKSMKLTFRGNTGGELYYDIFGDGEITRFHSLTLRSGYMSDSTLLRDPLCDEVAALCSDNVLTLKNRYCVLYINGEYWGIYSLREAYSTVYAADHLGADEDETAVCRSPVRSWFNEDMVALFARLGARPAPEVGFETIRAAIDLESLADWMVLEAYFGNYDLPGNIRYIRANGEGLWHYAFFDLDFGLRKETIDWWSVLDNGNQFGCVTTTAVRVESFRELLFTRMAALFEAGLGEELLLEKLDEYFTLLEDELPREFERWPDGVGDPQRCRAELETYITANRQRQCAASLLTHLHLKEDALPPGFPALDTLE